MIEISRKLKVESIKLKTPEGEFLLSPPFGGGVRHDLPAIACKAWQAGVRGWCASMGK
ncbi:MAG: hypothetical protein HOA57_04545 [Candidatus Magasanikbacteria bacterium]|jgi:hypothetical protein|nr:hypothetical protein [Candidatus Magasanikbacteria bacterium]MBT6819615.1 hypothetical protein [Candidatus Magasanikbacteria bacterium]